MSLAQKNYNIKTRIHSNPGNHLPNRNMMMVMKSILPGLVLLFLVSSIVSGQGSVLVKSLTQIEHFYTWQEAQAFCRR